MLYVRKIEINICHNVLTIIIQYKHNACCVQIIIYILYNMLIIRHYKIYIQNRDKNGYILFCWLKKGLIL